MIEWERPDIVIIRALERAECCGADVINGRLRAHRLGRYPHRALSIVHRPSTIDGSHGTWRRSGSPVLASSHVAGAPEWGCGDLE